MAIQVVILAAGMGTRLGKPWPKPLTVLSDGRSIMQQQMENVSQVFGDKARITVVVGFKLEMIIEAHPNASFVYNEIYDQTNTSKSLLKALNASQESGVLWLNGDVVFDAKVLERVASRIESEKSFVCVNTSATAEEEVKYTVDGEGFIKELSKTYFERGLELAIEKKGIRLEPVDISDLFAVEVDFQADLDRANAGLK